MLKALNSSGMTSWKMVGLDLGLEISTGFEG